MTAIATDRYTEYRHPAPRRGADVAASQTIYAMTLIVYDGSGNIRDGVQAASRYFAGVAEAGVDNSSGAAGDEQAVFWTQGIFKFASAGLTADDVGQKVYLLDNQTVVLGDHASLTQLIPVGTIAEYVSATECWVKIEPDAPEAHRPRQYTLKIAGVNAGALDLSSLAAEHGGADLHVHSIQAINAYLTADGSSIGLLAVTTNYTLTGGVISTADDQSANTLVIHCVATLQR